MAFAADGAEVHEDILARVAGDETEALGGVEPLHGAGFAVDAGEGFDGNAGARFVEAGDPLQDDGAGQAQQRQHDGRLIADEGQGGEQDQDLQDHGQHDQGGGEALQGRGVFQVAARGEQEAGQTEQCQVDGIALLQVGQGITTQTRDQGQQECGDARHEMDDLQHGYGFTLSG